MRWSISRAPAGQWSAAGIWGRQIHTLPDTSTRIKCTRMYEISCWPEVNFFLRRYLIRQMGAEGPLLFDYSKKQLFDREASFYNQTHCSLLNDSFWLANRLLTNETSFNFSAKEGVGATGRDEERGGSSVRKTNQAHVCASVKQRNNTNRRPP